MVKQIILTIPIQEFETIIRDCVRVELQKNKVEHHKEDADFISLKETAALLKISRPTLKAYTDAGYIKKYRVGHTHRYRKDEVIRCLQSVSSIKYSRREVTY